PHCPAASFASRLRTSASTHRPSAAVSGASGSTRSLRGNSPGGRDRCPSRRDSGHGPSTPAEDCRLQAQTEGIRDWLLHWDLKPLRRGNRPGRKTPRGDPIRAYFLISGFSTLVVQVSCFQSVVGRLINITT